VLEQERSAYRLIEGALVRITNKAEMQSVEEALKSHPLATVHMDRALKLFAERETPNYAKVIQEAVSAVEAQLQELTGKSKVADGVAELNKLGRGAHHKSLLNGFTKIYGWTSEDGSGIRHAGKGEPAPTQALAKYTLVTCSAFVNYLEELRATR
jgi:hypothetical protein